MESNEQNTTQPKRRNALVEAATGGIIGGIIGAITSLFNKKATAGKQMGWGVGLGALLGIVMNLFGKKPDAQQQPSAMLPPGQAEYPQGFTIAQVPQVLDLLVARGQLKPEQQATILASIKSGRQGFAGEIAIADGFATGQQVGQALADQAVMKAEAALVDITNISQFGPQATPQWLRANWGNNGVNAAPTQPTRIDGMSATANIAQNLVMLANANPQILPLVRDGVIAATYLTRGIAQGDSPAVPLGKMAESWRATMNNALQIAAQAAPQSLVDANGKPIDIQQFIAARNSEVTAAVQQSLASSQRRDQGQAR